LVGVMVTRQPQTTTRSAGASLILAVESSQSSR
jgi:hypothetical protein